MCVSSVPLGLSPSDSYGRVTTGFVHAGGVVPEKFDAVQANANIDAEYGNQGTDFAMIPKEGFGWYVCSVPSLAPSPAHDVARRTNASYQVGLEVLTQFQRRALGALTPPDTFFYGKHVAPGA